MESTRSGAPVAGPLTAAQAGLHACPVCAKLYPAGSATHCARCGAALHGRAPYSLQRAWAWLIAGMILYFPANLYPIMHSELLGQSTESTIIGGVIMLYEHHAYSVALVVFVASVLIPLLKFLVLIYLLASVRRHAGQRQEDRHRLYRLVEFVGRWSMVDVFVVAILAALVQFGHLAQVVPGMGAGAFAAMVVFTMLAAESLDPRLLWDE